MYGSIELVREVWRNADRLYERQAVEAAIQRMAANITAALSERNPVVLCVLHGGLVTTGHLLPRLEFPLQLDYLHAMRYREETRGGELRCRAKPSRSLEGRTVLIVDDILDEGVTLAAIQDFCRHHGAESVYSAVLVEKQLSGGVAATRADFVGLTVPDRYVFGFGMDYKGYCRNAPGIFAVPDGA